MNEVGVIGEIMTIFRIAKSKTKYFIMDSRILLDPNITATAKGVMAFICSKPDDWEINTKEISLHSTDDFETVAQALGDKEYRPVWKVFVWIIIILLVIEPALANRLKR